nr:hypothetical protein [Tanacetum cinerariifolium]
KAILTEAVSLNLIDLDLLKVDVAPLVRKLRKNRTTHTDYIRHTQDEAATLREIVESERLLSLLNTSLDYASLKDALRKLKGKVIADDAVTSHSINPEMLNVDVEPLNTRLLNNRISDKPALDFCNSKEKLVALTPKNKDKRVRFTEPITPA